MALIEDVLKLAPVISITISSISACLSAIALFFVTRTFKKTNKLNIRNSYLSLLDRYFKLREMAIKEPTIENIYKSHIKYSSLSETQKHYIFAIISFCEAIFILNEMKPLAEEESDVSWEGFIKNQMRTPTILEVWKGAEESVNNSKEAREFSKIFADWVKNNT